MPWGIGGFVTMRANTDDSLVGLPIGRFDGDAKADILLMQNRHFYIAPGMRDPVAKWSRQDMQ